MVDDVLALIGPPSSRAVTAAEVAPLGPLLVIGALLLVAVVIALLLGSGRLFSRRRSRSASGPADHHPEHGSTPEN